MSEVTTFRVLAIPEVRVCCLRCESESTRYGAWVPLDEVEDVCTDAVHRGRVVRLDRDVDLHVDAETAVLETRNLPVDGPLSHEQLEAWQDLYEAVGGASWPALLAWVDSGAWVEDGDGLPDPAAFQERYCGAWDSFEEYAQELAEETGLMEGWSETARSYFDWPRWARDLRYDYTVVDAPAGGVYVFRDL
ncbi:antirestriction protein ArdA [Micrococcus luteus]|uniref:antirestriction protein ArdA n=1 Tax=Micrococcus luteus TaxID=1270 RepID=UPI001E55FCF1|nr:antirestriction protein ArdA [Micrococcus luteus]MCD0172532.1 antirestriction protein ArdA [Micrococcus luteus]MCV7651386.1 antirestriction protein ArdA [Micrococcus luteus]